MSSFSNVTYAIPSKPHELKGGYFTSRSRPGEADHSINSRTPLIMATDSAVNPYFDADSGYMAPDVPIQLVGKSNGVISLSHKQPRSCVKPNGVSSDTSADSADERRYRGLSLTNPNGVPLSRGITTNANSLSQDEDYENDPNSYLTPKDPPHYDRTFAFDEIPVTGVDSDHGVTAVKTSRARLQRFDSGVEDCVTERGSNCTILSNSLSEPYHFMAGPRLSAAPEQHYEDIDKYSKNKAAACQLTPRSSIDKFSSNNGSAGNMNNRPLPLVNSPSMTSQCNSDDQQLILETSMAETVSHPLTQPELRHNSNVNTLPHTYSQLMSHNNNYPLKEMAHETPRSHCRFTAALVVIFITSAAALSLSIYVLISTGSSKSAPSEHPTNQLAHAEDVKQLLFSLQKEMMILKEENKNLTEQIAAQRNNTWYIEQEMGHLSLQQNTFHAAMETMVLNISQEISNMTLTPGPQGPAGVVNFSMCRHDQSQHLELASDIADIKTDYRPSDHEVNEYFVIFAYCKYTPGTHGTLEMSPRGDQYRCVCKGRVQNQSHSYCAVFILMCPKTT